MEKKSNAGKTILIIVITICAIAVAIFIVSMVMNVQNIKKNLSQNSQTYQNASGVINNVESRKENSENIDADLEEIQNMIDALTN